MAQQSSIEWTDRTWNPIRGCSKISAGCENCYAMYVAARFSGHGQPYDGLAKREPVNWTGELRLIEPALYEPLRRRKQTMYFVNSMSDLFHERMPREWIEKIFAVMALSPQHTFQVLTKRADVLAAFFADREAGQMMRTIGASTKERIYTCACDLTDEATRSTDAQLKVYLHWLTGEENDCPWPLRNVWLGVSVEDQAAAERRIPDLLRTPAAVRFLSCEPLIGPVRLLGRWLDELDWVIVGGESAQACRARWCDIQWIREIVGECQVAGVPVFVKQLGSRSGHGQERTDGWRPLRHPKGGDPAEWPADLRVRQFPAQLETAGV